MKKLNANDAIERSKTLPPESGSDSGNQGETGGAIQFAPYRTRREALGPPAFDGQTTNDYPKDVASEPRTR